MLVLAILKQGLNCDWDRLCELANKHRTLRQMIGHDRVAHEYEMADLGRQRVSAQGPLLADVSKYWFRRDTRWPEKSL